jgi:hypothetical protein
MRGPTERLSWQDQEHRRSHAKAARTPRKPDSLSSEIAHWVRSIGLLAPLAITEFVPDAARSKRLIRITSVAAAVLSEGFHAHRLHQQRDRARDALETCESGAMP